MQKNNLSIIKNYFKGKRILITGNTGFKGCWLSLYLKSLGADVYGIAGSDNKNNVMYESCIRHNDITQYYIDILDLKNLKNTIGQIEPEIIFHLAGQAITLNSYQNPLESFHVNGIGTANILECLRLSSFPCDVICITSDKCYKNNEWVWGYKESDELAGLDPYSASKSIAEIIIQSYYHSYFKENNRVRITSGRAGNIIGGGDWSPYRIVPSTILNWIKREPIALRYPQSIRPWNYVLDVVWGYLLLAYKMQEKSISGEAYNFGPLVSNEIPVNQLVDKMWNNWKDHSFSPVEILESPEFFEHQYLKLSIDKAHSELNWLPQTNIDQAIQNTVEWYENFYQQTDMRAYTIQHILSFQNKLDNGC